MKVSYNDTPGQLDTWADALVVSKCRVLLFSVSVFKVTAVVDGILSVNVESNPQEHTSFFS